LIFLPVQAILRVYGGEPLERVVASISVDEYRHTNFNWYVSGDVNLGLDKEFETELKTIFNWVIETLPNPGFWVNIFQELQSEGASDSLDSILNYGIHKAPFEISNTVY
jgi:hypothetical protein